MSTANKLSYLNDTKSLLRTSLNKFGSNILSTDTFRSYDTKLNEIYDKLPKITQSGAGFTLENVQNGQVDDFKMIGTDLEQNTTTGKQLFDINSEINTNSLIDAGITSTFNEDGTITVNGEKTANYKYIRYSVTLPAGTYYFCGCPSGGSNSSYSSLVQLTQDVSSQVFDIGNGGTFTLTEQTTIQYFPVRVGSASLTFNNTIFRPMISTSPVTYDDFEKYTGGIASPNPDYPQETKVVEGRQVITDSGKNTYDEEYELGYYNIPDGTKVYPQDSYGYRSTNLNELKPNTEYKISVNGELFENSIRLFYYDKNKTFLSTSSTSSGKFTTPNNCYYFAWHSSYLRQIFQDGIEKLMFSDTIYSLDYEPYYEPVSYNIDLTNDLLKYSKCDFTPATTSWYFLDSSGSAFGKNIGTKTNIKFPVEINKTYTFRYNISIAPNAFQLCYENENVVATLGKSIGNNTFTFTSDRNGYVIPRVRVQASSQIKITDISVVKGEEDYYDYKLAKIPNTDYKNRIYKSNGNWYFEENVKNIVLDGSEEITIQNIGTDNWYYQLSVNCYKTEQLKQMCSHYNNSGIYNSNTYQGIMMLTEGNFVRIRYGEEDTVANFKAWLSNNNVTLWYPLINSITNQITNTTLINQLEALYLHTGTNIITISNDNNIIPEIEITRLKELEKLA